jgi:hypothetical protein
MSIYALGDLVPSIDPDAYVHPDATVIGAGTTPTWRAASSGTAA